MTLPSDDLCPSSECCAPGPRSSATSSLLWLQGLTLAWMLIECAVALYAAERAHSSLLLVFGADSLVELLSALLVLTAALGLLRMSLERVNRAAGLLLLLLAGLVASASLLALWRRQGSESTWLGIAIASAALLVMPALALWKRRLAVRFNDRALAADAVQSATCAWLALGTLLGLLANFLLGWKWLDPCFSLLVLPLLLLEARRALRGESCGCC